MGEEKKIRSRYERREFSRLRKDPRASEQAKKKKKEHGTSEELRTNVTGKKFFRQRYLSFQREYLLKR